MENKTFKWLEPKYIQLSQMPTKILKMSGPLGWLHLDANIPKNVSLVNDLVRMAKVEKANPAPDAYGNICPLLPGDTIYCDNTMFSEVWQKDELGSEGMKFVGLKNHILAYERDGVLYGYQKLIPDGYPISIPDKNEDKRGIRVNKTGMHVYKPNSYMICKHRPDVYEKYLANSTVMSFRQLGGEAFTNFAITRSLHSVFEVVSEHKKGTFIFTPYDHAIEINVDPADVEAHGLDTVLSRGTYYGIEVDVVKAEIEVKYEAFTPEVGMRLEVVQEFNDAESQTKNFDAFPKKGDILTLLDFDKCILDRAKFKQMWFFEFETSDGRRYHITSLNPKTGEQRFTPVL